MKNYLSLSIITVIILIRFPAVSYTQNMLTLSLNAPRDSDELHKCRTEYSDPGKAGHNICWDFSKALRQTNYENPTTIIKYDHTILLQTYPFSIDMMKR